MLELISLFRSDSFIHLKTKSIQHLVSFLTHFLFKLHSAVLGTLWNVFLGNNLLTLHHGVIFHRAIYFRVLSDMYNFGSNIKMHSLEICTETLFTVNH